MLDHALSFAAQGWPVFPCDPATKRPLLAADRDGHGRAIRNSGGLRKASTDPQLITQWWRRWPKAMIGVPTGLQAGQLDHQNGCGAFVLDLDVPKGDGVGSAGRHLFFKMSVGEDAELLGNRAGLLPVDQAIGNFLMGAAGRIHAAILSFCIGVIAPIPMFGRSLMYVHNHRVA
jgi:hypothetical protein